MGGGAGGETCSMFPLEKNSNNQRKLTISSDRFPSWKLTFVNIECCKSASQQLMRVNMPAVASVPFWSNGQASYQVNSLWSCELT